MFLTCLILPNSAKCRSFGEGIKLRYSVLPHFALLLTLTWKRLTLNGLEEGEYHRPWETCTVGIRPFIHHRDSLCFDFTRNTLNHPEGNDSPSLFKRHFQHMCQIFCLWVMTTLWDETGCGYWSLAKDGPDSGNFASWTRRKEAAPPTHTE